MHKSSLCLAIFFFFFFIFPVEPKPTTNIGFSLDLIHSQSPKSPFRYPSATHSDFFAKSALHSIARSNHFGSSFSDEKVVQSSVYPNRADYLMRFSIGTPKLDTYVVLDTGSDVVWVQCSPCNSCIRHSFPTFNPSKSSTYRVLPCNSTTCALGQRYTRCTNNLQCGYYLLYADNTYSNGTLANETLNFNSSTGVSVSIPNFVFGCGRNISGHFSGNEAGIAGLGNGTLSLINQLGPQTNYRFSYCLILFSYSSSSKLRFGSDAILNGTNVVSTPLIYKTGLPYYFITLQGINIGTKSVAVKPSANNPGNIIIDSGTTLMVLKTSVYNSLETMVKSMITATPMRDPGGNYRLCYSSQANINYPDMVFRFDGANVTLKPYNTFAQVSSTLICMLIVPTSGFPIYGNFAQVNFDVSYDLPAKRLSFAPSDCTKR